MSTLKVDDIQSRQSTDDAISLASDSSVSLKHSASAKLTTTSTGVTVTGTCTATAFSGDGSALTGLSSGLSSDAQKNTIGGTNAGGNLASGAEDNLILGYDAGTGAITGDENVLLGFEAGKTLTTSFNVAIGGQALKSAAGSGNVAVGRNALENCIGNSNTALGRQAAYNLTDADKHVAIGYRALYNLTSSGNYTSNVAIGEDAGFGITTGNGKNVAIGYDAMSETEVGAAQKNVAIGYRAFRYGGHGGQDNTAVGYECLAGASGTSNANGNSGLGAQALNDVTTGEYNTACGFSAGSSVNTGENNLLLGRGAGGSSSPSGTINSGSNNVVLGNNSISNLYCADTSISSSDSRDKTDVTSFNIGLAWVEALRPVTYRWDRRTWYGTDEQPYGTPDGSKKRSKLHIGFLAQEALEVEKTNGYGTSNDDSLVVHLNEDEMSYGMKYERLVPILVNAIKELSTKNNVLEARIQSLETA